jgi:hypothetical protein
MDQNVTIAILTIKMICCDPGRHCPRPTCGLSHSGDLISPPKLTIKGSVPSLLAKVLVLGGADVEARTTGGFTALQIAAIYGHVDMVIMLCEMKTDVQACFGEGMVLDTMWADRFAGWTRNQRPGFSPCKWVRGDCESHRRPQ